MVISSNTPSDLIFERNRAFARGDFGFIYDSYHPESNFRRQFIDRDAYICYGQSNLSPDFKIKRCHILVERIEADEAQIIYLMEMVAQGVVQKYAELTWLRLSGDHWLYHRGQKMTADELPPDPESLDFAAFDKLDPGTIF